MRKNAWVLVLVVSLLLPAWLMTSCSGQKEEAAGQHKSDDQYELVVKNAKPQLAKFQPPFYSPEAKKQGLTGTVLVKVLVGKDGGVKEAEIQKGVHAMLDQAALIAARRCIFLPARRDGEMVEAWTTLPFEFKLDKR